MTSARLCVALFQMVLAAAVFAQTGDKQNFLAWGDSPEAYYMTTQERAEWQKVLSQDAATEFIKAYWARRGAAFHNEVRQRAEAADKYFGIHDRKGSTTEKGRVFMILGAPDRVNEQRSMEQRPAGSGGTSTFGTNNPLEAQARTRTTWLYKKDRLPQALGVPEMTINFQTDVSRGDQVIENPGLIEPYLKRVVDFQMQQLFASIPAAKPQAPAEVEAKANGATTGPRLDPALWTAPEKLNGAFFTGESFVSPTDKPFYAVSFYLPKLSFAYAKDVVMAGAVKDQSGKEVATIHQKLTAPEYDPDGDRFVDASIELPAGKYVAVFALYDADEKTLLASTRRDIEVAEATKTRVSPMFMTSRIDTLDTQQAFDPFTFIATKYVIKGDRRFHKSDKIGCFTFIANPTQASMNMKIKVTRDGKVIDAGAWTPVDLAQTGPRTYLLATQFPASAFQSGHYTIELSLNDPKANTTYNQTAEFDVPQ